MAGDETAFWERVECALREVSDVPPAERERRLDELCAGDKRLKTEVLSLLEAHSDLDGFLETPISAIVPGENVSINQRVGAYQLDELIGTGGMGAVYRAHRCDGAYEQEVAIKFIRNALADPDLPRRFRRERQVLAKLEHPNIARLLDGGVTDDDQPYLVMEFVRGEPILDYCANNNLSVEARLELFDRVCAAVQHAHSKLIVHRDLKPQHVLVDSTGVPRLLDFGIAAVLDESAQGAGVTLTNKQRFTPKYASPEQMRGEPVTTATDVYALGVILYQLLSGHHPFEDRATSSRSTDRADSTSDTRAPSRVATDQRAARQLRGDLDTIVLTAIHPETLRRYGSVEALREDLRKYQNDLPISARPDSWSYRTRKFIGRNREAIAVTAIILALLVAGIVVTLRQAHISELHRIEAEASQQVTEKVAAFLESIITAADPREGGKDITMRDALDLAAERIEPELGSTPVVEVRVRSFMGGTYRTLGALAQAETQLVRAHDIALEKLGNDNEDTANAAHELALVRMNQGDFENTKSLAREAWRIRQTLFGDDYDNTTESRNVLAQAHSQLGESDEALAHLEAVVATRTKMHGAAHPDTLVARKQHAGVYFRMGDAEKALPLLKEIYDLQREAQGENHPDTLIAANDYGSALRNVGQPAEAVRWFNIAIEGLSRHFPAGSIDVVIPRFNLARALAIQHLYEQSNAQCLQALTDGSPALGDDHYVLALVRSQIAQNHLAMDDPLAAQPYIEQAHRDLVAAFGPDHQYTQIAATTQAKVQAALDELGWEPVEGGRP